MSASAKTTVSQSTLTSQDVATIVGDVPMQDLSSEQLLRDAPRLESCGQICPALNGIPLLYKLGQGGMGAVYYGIHPRLRSEVAVKVLPFHLAAQDPGMIQRFFREAQIAAKVRSPHLVNCIDVNEESGLFFLVMEFVPGVTVGHYLKKAIEGGNVGLPELEAIDICLAACLGLDAAHVNGVIHRDLKPDNIMIPYKSRQTKTYDIKNSKLMDLGLARSEEGNQSLTGVQAAMGTPGYMAPEQALDAKTADKRSDVFSMGATLYALLTGRPPFKGEVVMKVLMATMHEPHPPITNLRPDLSPGLVQLIDRCLDKRQENRYADSRALIRALKAVRKVLSPDGAFGGEDDGGSDAVEESRPAPMISTTIGTGTSGGFYAHKTKIFAGVGLAACLAIGFFVFKGSGPKPVDVPNVVKVDVQALPDNVKNFVLKEHSANIDSINQLISLKQFDDADLKLQTVAASESQYAKQLPILDKELSEVRSKFEAAKKESAFNDLASQVDVQLKKSNVDEAKALAAKLEPATAVQAEIKNKKLAEIIKIEKKTKNKAEFTDTLLKAKEDGKIDDRIALVTKALDLIPDEPHAVELMKQLKVIQAKEQNDFNFKKNYSKAQDAYISKNYEAANKAITEARRLQPDNKDAQNLSKKIVAEAGDILKKQFQEEAKKAAFEAFNQAKDFYDKKDSAKALEAIDLALANVADDEQYVSMKKKIDFLIGEESRVATVAQKKAAYEEYIKDATESLDGATDVKKIEFLDVALEKIEEAEQLKLDAKPLYNDADDPKTSEMLKGMLTNLAALKTKIVDRQNDLKTRIQYDTWVQDAAKVLAANDNEFESKMESVDGGLKMIADALKVADAAKVVTADEAKVPQDLKAKLEAIKSKIEIRDSKRADVAAYLKKGDEALKNRKFDMAVESYKAAEPIAAVLSAPEKEAVQAKWQVAVTAKENFTKITKMLVETDKLNTEEKYEEALKQLDDASKIAPDDPRLVEKKGVYESGKAAVQKLTEETLKSAQAAMKVDNLDGAVEVMDKVAASHPNRPALVDPMKDLKRIQATAKEVEPKLSDLLVQAEKVRDKIGLKAGDNVSKVRGAKKEFPKLKSDVIAKLGAEGFEKSWKTANDFLAAAGELVSRANGGLAAMNAISAQIDEANKKPEVKSTNDALIEQQNGKKEGRPKGEEEKVLN